MNILFDIGNVILGIDFIEALKKVIPHSVNDVDTKIETIMQRKDPFEAGLIPSEKYFPWAAKQIELGDKLEIFMEAWQNIFTPNLPMWKCIESLHSDGHKLYLFSNINNPHKDYILRHYPIFNKFSGAIYSFQTGHIKPEKNIYDIAISKYNLTAEKTLYIDDLADNIQAGEKAGLLCHQYRIDQHDHFITWLKAHLK